MAKLWGGRFSGETDELLERYNASIGFDHRLYHADITGSIAYARALGEIGILEADEVAQIVRGLQAVLREFEAGAFQFLTSDEDIHTAVERRLHELIGDVAGKLHTGRSRNDQVATDTRLYLMEKVKVLRVYLMELQRAIVEQANAHLKPIMPGYTHLQPAQPILFAHWLMSFFWMLQRDHARLDDLSKRVAILPLGSSALAGNAFEIDRAALAQWLGFTTINFDNAGELVPQISENSLDAVADRDFIAEFLFWAALLQTHLSRLAEDLIIYSSAEFDFVELDDAYSTGSSIMPQKKNPDPLELARGKTGRLLGNLVSLMTTMKGLPSAYDKDLQEDKEPLFDAIDTLEIELPVLAGVVETLHVNHERMAAALRDEMLATDLADYLVRRGVPFRESHRLVGQAVRTALEHDCSLRDLPLEAYQNISPKFSADVYDALDFRRSVEQRTVYGGTATSAVQEQIAKARGLLDVKREA